MPVKQSQRAEINSFVQGLITEASPLNFPANALADGENFELNRDGSNQRRLGMDLEENHTFRPTGISVNDIVQAGHNAFKWIEVSGDTNIELLVIQFNRNVYFFDLSKESLSSDGYLGSITLSEFPTNTRFSFASIEGSLIAVAGIDSFAVIEYKNNQLGYYLDRIKIRDLFGVEETNTRYERDSSYRGALDPLHYYNLQNQSWGTPKRAKVTYTTQEERTRSVPNPDFNPLEPPGPDNPQFITETYYVTVTTSSEKMADPTLAYEAHYGFAPSNSEHVWAGLQYTPVQYNPPADQMQDPYEQMYLNLYKETWGTELLSGKGYFIIDALRRGGSRQEQLSINLSKYPELNKTFSNNTTRFSSFPFKSDYTTGGASCVAEFAGRIFFSGFNGEIKDGDKRSPNYSNYVFFSVLVKNKTDLPKCYQEGDPTGREAADVLDTDGGFLRISEAKNIISLINIGTKLIVIASNGVWSIEGGSDYGFSAANYKVAKISTFGGISSSTIVLEGDKVYYWSEDGIYILASDEFGDLKVNNISLPTIQTFYENIPSVSKAKASAIYDSLSKKIRWVFYEGVPASPTALTRELVLDTALGCFSVNRIYNLNPNSVSLLNLFQSSPYRVSQGSEPILAGNEEVIAGTEPVILNREIVSSGTQATKYVAIRNMGGSIYFTFSYYNNFNFKDWENIDGVGVDAKAYGLTGAQVVGDSAINKQIPYLVMHFNRTETITDQNSVPMNQSGCKFRVQWSFANSVSSHKWTPMMQGYRYRMPLLGTGPNAPYDNGFEVITTKNKVRGIGRAFALYFETEPGKDCQLLGWNITINGNAIT